MNNLIINNIQTLNNLNNTKLEQVFWDKLEAKYKIV